jgi:hypothetical protein
MVFSIPPMSLKLLDDIVGGETVFAAGESHDQADHLQKRHHLMIGA